MNTPVIEGQIVLTANARLARWLLYLHDERQKRAGLKSWPTPPIYPLTGWRKQIWLDSWPSHYALSDIQSVKLWENIIERDPSAPMLALLHLRGTAERAARAYRLIREYRLPDDPEPYRWTEETKSFRRWIDVYESRLNDWEALDPACLTDAIHESMQRGSIPLPHGITLAGFGEITPQLQAWLDFLKARNVEIRFWPDEPLLKKSGKTPPNAAVRAYKDAREEAIQCARWLRANLKPGETAGVVVPGLNACKNLLRKELSAELAPESIFPWLERELPFDISPETPLAQEPPVRFAQRILSLSRAAVPFDIVSDILSSQFIHGGEGEAAARTAIDIKLRNRNMVSVDWHRLESLAPGETAPRLAAIFKTLREYVADSGDKPPSEWGRVFALLLRHIGWPNGDLDLTDKLNCVYEAWIDCLDNFSSLDRVLGKISRAAAASGLAGIAEEKLFQPKTTAQSIQIVGLREAFGMRFDHLWVAGCTADKLPALPSPNPFLPMELQKKHDLPHYNSDSELFAAEHALANLLVASPHIVLSHPQWERETELRISPLLNSFLKQHPAPRIDTSSKIQDNFQSPAPLEIWQDTPQLPFSTAEYDNAKQTLSHQGYRVLKNQADCPFRAFASHRLNARKLTAPEIDFNDAERGSLVHKALELFWKKTQNRARLQQLKSAGGLDSTIRDSVQQAVESALTREKLDTQRQFTQQEMQRIVTLLRDWLEVELLRSDFEVMHKEKSDAVKVGDLELAIRIDRMDRVDGDKRILIDYKTGQIDCKDWFGDRVQEPQLPLYALKYSADGIAYAVVKKHQKEMNFYSIASEPTIFKDAKTIDYAKSTQCANWEELLEYWRKNLTALAEQFLAGHLQIDPFDNPNTCRNCGLETLCRIGETDRACELPEEEES